MLAETRGAEIDDGGAVFAAICPPQPAWLLALRRARYLGGDPKPPRGRQLAADIDRPLTER
jgi:hypothetical protein